LASEDRQAMHMSQLKEKAQVQNKLHVPWMFPECPLCVSWMFPECSSRCSSRWEDASFDASDRMYCHHAVVIIMILISGACAGTSQKIRTNRPSGKRSRLTLINSEETWHDSYSCFRGHLYYRMGARR
jgi:hypothetical protein